MTDTPHILNRVTTLGPLERGAGWRPWGSGGVYVTCPGCGEHRAFLADDYRPCNGSYLDEEKTRTALPIPVACDCGYEMLFQDVAIPGYVHRMLDTIHVAAPFARETD